MTTRTVLPLGAAGLLLWGATAAAAQAPNLEAEGAASPPAAAPAAPAADRDASEPERVIQHIRPADQRGVIVFEAPKDDATPFTGFRVDWGAAFAQQFQMLDHENEADPRMVTDAKGQPYDANELMGIGAGFNLPTANLTLNAQLAPGIRVAMTAYLSSRHHQEAWVKDGYLQIDASPIDHPWLHSLMEVVTLRAGMFQLNYGDAHFRRSDNGNVLHNPFVGNLILDAWNFEMGAEVYARSRGFLAMAGVTGGQNKGDVTNPATRGPAFLGKLGFDRMVGDDFRVRLTGSVYRVERTPSANLYFGDRAGSRYYMVMENTAATLTGNFTSGLINPGFANRLTAVQVNPFAKIGGLELFGVLERAEGKASAETATREFRQYAMDAVYRFAGDDLYVGARYNEVEGRLRGFTSDIAVERVALAGGWFVTPTVLLKGEYVDQRYRDFPGTDLRHGGRFNGFVVEGAVAF